MHFQPFWNNYFNRGRYFNSGCDVKLSLKFILNHFWNNNFNSGRYFNSGCNISVLAQGLLLLGIVSQLSVFFHGIFFKKCPGKRCCYPHVDNILIKLISVALIFKDLSYVMIVWDCLQKMITPKYAPYVQVYYYCKFSSFVCLFDSGFSSH